MAPSVVSRAFSQKSDLNSNRSFTSSRYNGSSPNFDRCPNHSNGPRSVTEGSYNGDLKENDKCPSPNFSRGRSHKDSRHHHHHHHHSQRKPDETETYYIVPKSMLKKHDDRLEEVRSEISEPMNGRKKSDRRIGENSPRRDFRPKQKEKNGCWIYLGFDFPLRKSSKPRSAYTYARDSKSIAPPFISRTKSESVMQDFLEPRMAPEPKICPCELTKAKLKAMKERMKGLPKPPSMHSVANLMSEDRVFDYQCKLEELQKKKCSINVEDPLFCRPQKRHFPSAMNSNIFNKSYSIPFDDDHRTTLYSYEGMALPRFRKFSKRRNANFYLV